MQIPGIKDVAKQLQDGQNQLVNLLENILDELRLNNWLLAAEHARALNKGSGAREELALANWELNNDPKTTSGSQSFSADWS